ncbi:MAG: hypothetical protein JOY96_07995 [Verrucomicrobia bacterium]|nr:hypothetical protein [Verrucomicrobiota bacterium]MBV9674636.1 hypothetical protein [Verrucomicrobiota bacterium]
MLVELMRLLAKTFLFSLWLTILATSLPGQASDSWDFDSISPADAPRPAPDPSRDIYMRLLRMVGCWNAHDVEGYMLAFWNSPQLLVVVDSEEYNGWQELHENYLNGYPDRNAMGFLEPLRVKIRFLHSDEALVLNWWTISQGGARDKIVGTSTMIFQKIDGDWKIVVAHTSFLEP